MQAAIEHALIVLTWHENLQKEDVPPEYLWEDSEGLEMWWKTVEDRQEDGRSTTRGRADDSDEEAPGLQENDYARYLKQG